MQVENTTDQTPTPVDTFRVALVCMPFATALVPSIQVGLLTAIAEQAGFPTDAYHLNLNLAASLTPEVDELTLLPSRSHDRRMALLGRGLWGGGSKG